MTLKDRTSASFGFEWAKFSDIYSEYEENFLSYIHPLTPECFKDKFVLDAGCGAGRHAFFAAQYGAKSVVAFDVSEQATKTAERNLAGLDNVSVVRGDIFLTADNPMFDIVMCIGVLHHLENPQDGFNALVRLAVKRGGIISIWVYSKKDNKLAMYLYEPVRKITTRIPHRILYYVAWLPAILLHGMNKVRFPLFTHYRKFPFRTKWNDAFDVLSAPSAKYYDLEEIRAWFEQAGLKDIQVSYRMLDGKAKGIKGMGVKP